MKPQQRLSATFRTFPALFILSAFSIHTALAADATPKLRVSGGRSAQQQQSAAGLKLDAALAELTRNLGLARSAQMLADLHSISPGAHFRQHSTDAVPLVLIDANAPPGQVQTLRNALVALGLQTPSVFGNGLSGWLPVGQIDAASRIPSLHAIRATMWRTRAGVVTSQGDFVQRSDVLRSTYPTLDGTGVMVGILSDSYNCYQAYKDSGTPPASGPAGYAPNGILTTASQDVATGDLPAGITPLMDADCPDYGAPTQLPFGDEGRAMMQIVHDVAPGASLQFYTAEVNGESAFANGIGALQQAGAKVIADDIGFFDEPFFQDGVIAQEIDTVEAKGVAYFSAAGNDASNSYDNLAPAFTTLSNTAPTAGEYLLNFDTSGKTNATALSVTIPALEQGEFVALILEWDQPYYTGTNTGATSHLNLCVTGSGTDQIIDLQGSQETCTGANSTGADPVEILLVSNPANATTRTAPEQINILVGLADGTTAPGRIKLAVDGDGLNVVINQFATNSPTLQGHPGATGAAAVGAAAFGQTPLCGTTPAVLETFSSVGGNPILFDANGNRLSTPVVRQKPDFVGPDGVNNTFLGDVSAPASNKNPVASCNNNSTYPNFFGTSAATPHAAGVAALMLQANPALTPTQIYTALRTTASPMGATPPDFSSGYGFIQADAALATLPPGGPTLTLSQSSVTTGGTTALTWSSINTTACTASGGWSGTQMISGSTTVTAPSTAGSTNYTLTCSNAVGSAATTVTLTATAVSSNTSASSSSSGGGGGALDEIVLLVLAGAGIVRLAGGAQRRSQQ
jgi:hypothetical protein